jgi:hypothetical protein
MGDNCAIKVLATALETQTKLALKQASM